MDHIHLHTFCLNLIDLNYSHTTLKEIKNSNLNQYYLNSNVSKLVDTCMCVLSYGTRQKVLIESADGTHPHTV